MLTTSRREVFADEQSLSKPNSAVDAKILGMQSYAINSGVQKSNVSTLERSYFADDQEIAVKLFGAEVPVEEWKSIDEADTENYTNPDLMPTGVTMETRTSVLKPSQNKVIESEQKAYVNIRNLTQKGKVALVAYTAVVLTLVLIIALTAVGVSASMANIATVQAEINKTMQEIDSMYVDVEENIDAYAAELGLVSVENASTAYYNPIDTREEVTYEISENWFDNFCEWVSSIFGG